MRVFPTPFHVSFFASLIFLVASFCGQPSSRADQISIGETYVEKLVVDEVVWSGTSTFEIVLPLTGMTFEEIDGNTEINVSIGDLQWVQILDGAEDYEEGALTATFREIDYNNDGNEVDVIFVRATWNTRSFSLSGTFRNFSNAGQANFFDAWNRVDEGGQFQDTLLADVSFGSASSTHPVAISGSNSRTRRVIDEEEIFLSNIQLSGSATLPPNDTTRPTVSITTPAANGRLLTPVISGKASDNTSVAEVLYRIGEDSFSPATGTTSWSAELPLLLPGTNVVEVKSIDQAGNESTVLRRTFFYVVTSPLIVEFNPEWGSTTLTNGQLLELGRSYTIIAKPAPGYLFQDWSGTVNSQNATLNFVMEPDFILQPNFVPNPFFPIKGIYNGLFSDPNGITPATAGFITVTVKDSGAYSGRIFLNGSPHSISGTFNTGGQATKLIVRRGKPSLNVQLQLGFDGGLYGAVVQENITSDLFAELTQTATNAANTKYTLLIPPASDPATAPGGYGFGTATVDRKNKLRFSGVLSDGTIANQSAAVSAFGKWPVYASLYRGEGVLMGWMTFADEPESDLRGDITWTKNSGVRGKYYTNGFTLSGAAVGSQYVAPAMGANVLQSTNPMAGQIEFNAGNLSAPLTNSFLLSANSLTVTSTNKTRLTAARLNGLLRGNFVHPDTGRSTSLKGAVLQKAMWGGGFFLGTNQSGAFTLQPDPVIP